VKAMPNAGFVMGTHGASQPEYHQYSIPHMTNEGAQLEPAPSPAALLGESSMKYVSARQASHDSYYTKSKCQMDVNIELARLGAWVQYSSKINTCNAAAHQYMAGKIQGAIARLPPPLRLLGDWLYAPEGFSPAGAENALWKVLAVLCEIEEDSDEWYLARCALHRYRELAWSRPEAASQFRTPQQIKRWLLDQHGIELYTRRWGRDYGRDRLLDQISKLDSKALGPVGEVVYDTEKESVAVC